MRLKFYLMSYKIFSLGEDALTVDFGNEISVKLNIRVLKLAELLDENAFEGFVEVVPAYASVTVFYDVSKVRKNYPEFFTAFDAVESLVKIRLENQNLTQISEAKPIEIPVCFDEEFSLDLDFVAMENDLSKQEVIKIFLGETYRVFMLGFLPGFSYMGELNEKIAAPRKKIPRARVPAGSIGIAGRQTGIYSLESPGGWQIIGKTPVELFTPNSEIPTFLKPGESVKFYEIDKAKFLKLKSENK